MRKVRKNYENLEKATGNLSHSVDNFFASQKICSARKKPRANYKKYRENKKNYEKSKTRFFLDIQNYRKLDFLSLAKIFRLHGCLGLKNAESNGIL